MINNKFKTISLFVALTACAAVLVAGPQEKGVLLTKAQGVMSIPEGANGKNLGDAKKAGDSKKETPKIRKKKNAKGKNAAKGKKNTGKKNTGKKNTGKKNKKDKKGKNLNDAEKADLKFKDIPKGMEYPNFVTPSQDSVSGSDLKSQNPQGTGNQQNLNNKLLEENAKLQKIIEDLNKDKQNNNKILGEDLLKMMNNDTLFSGILDHLSSNGLISGDDLKKVDVSIIASVLEKNKTEEDLKSLQDAKAAEEKKADEIKKLVDENDIKIKEEEQKIEKLMKNIKKIEKEIDNNKQKNNNFDDSQLKAAIEVEEKKIENIKLAIQQSKISQEASITIQKIELNKLQAKVTKATDTLNKNIEDLFNLQNEDKKSILNEESKKAMNMINKICLGLAGDNADIYINLLFGDKGSILSSVKELSETLDEASERLSNDIEKILKEKPSNKINPRLNAVKKCAELLDENNILKFIYLNGKSEMEKALIINNMKNYAKNELKSLAIKETKKLLYILPSNHKIFKEIKEITSGTSILSYNDYIFKPIVEISKIIGEGKIDPMSDEDKQNLQNLLTIKSEIEKINDELEDVNIDLNLNEDGVSKSNNDYVLIKDNKIGKNTNLIEENYNSINNYETNYYPSVYKKPQDNHDQEVSSENPINITSPTLAKYNDLLQKLIERKAEIDANNKKHNPKFKPKQIQVPEGIDNNIFQAMKAAVDAGYAEVILGMLNIRDVVINVVNNKNDIQGALNYYKGKLEELNKAPHTINPEANDKNPNYFTQIINKLQKNLDAIDKNTNESTDESTDEDLI